MKGKGTSISRRGATNTPSPVRQKQAVQPRRSHRNATGLATTSYQEDDDDMEALTDPEDAEEALFNSRPLRSSNNARHATRSSARIATNAEPSSANATTPTTARRKPERKRTERKASVRKESYDLDGTDSELSDAPEQGPSSGVRVVVQRSDDAEDNDDDDDVNLTESDDDMAQKLQAAGDGESLLGSALSDMDGGETDQEEERFIIEDTDRRQAKIDARRQQTTDTAEQADPSVQPSINTGDVTATVERRRSSRDDDPFPDNASGSLSPQTLQQLGIDGLFEGADGFQSSSEPEFTDFFGSDSEMGSDDDDDGLILAAMSDDEELTTDDDDDDMDESDISDLDEALLSAPFLGEALAAGAGTQVMPTGTTAEQTAQADVPLLVIEDLDGRLIYARAGDGEAVFGSDGEFEIVDDSEEDSDEDDDAHFLMDGFDGTRWTGWRHDDGEETDEGDTTDELPNEDMPFPRLLVGSVAPHGGRNARRARALAARTRRLSPAGRSREASRASDLAGPISGGQVGAPVQAGQADGKTDALQDVDFSISTEDLARDPQATLEAAAKSLGLTVDEVAQLIIGTNVQPAAEGSSSAAGAAASTSAFASPDLNKNLPLSAPVTPQGSGLQPLRRAPQMGSFMPTSSKSVHRAVIDGSKQAPSPFSTRYGTQRKGLIGRKRPTGQASSSSKRLRRESMASQTTLDNDLDTALTGSALMDDADTQQSTSAHRPVIDEMDLDDVMDASMMWRGSYSSSPPLGPLDERASGSGAVHDKKSARGKGSRASANGDANSGTSTSPAKHGGLNLNAVARWHRVPMNAFRDSQNTAATNNAGGSGTGAHQPLGSFLLTRARGGQARAHQNAGLRAKAEHSPFRGRGRGDSIHLGQAPAAHTLRDGFIVSPILWPSNRHGQAMTTTSASSAADAQAAGPSNGTASEARKTVTRREKRERKARKAALKAATVAAEVDGKVETDPSTATDARPGAGRLASPSAGMPRLSITDASPLPSPTAKTVPLPTSSTSQASITDTMSSEQAGNKVVNDTSSMPIDIPASSAPSTAKTGQASDDRFTVASQPAGSGVGIISSSASSSLSSQHQPPSSVFGMPLHSPLFGSILNPTNLGFRDDLDERDEDGSLSI